MNQKLVVVVIASAFCGYVVFGLFRHSGPDSSGISPGIDSSGEDSGEIVLPLSSQQRLSVAGKVKSGGVDVDTQDEVHSRTGVPWRDAKLSLREDFVPSPFARRSINEGVMRLLIIDKEVYPGLACDLDLTNTSDVDWSQCIQGLDGNALAFSKTDEEDINVLVNEAKVGLEELSKDAQALYEVALLQYWEQDLGYRVPVEGDGSEGKEVPRIFYETVGQGLFNIQFEALSVDTMWKIGVNFDSADFPALEDVLQEANRVKRELYHSMQKLGR